MSKKTTNGTEKNCINKIDKMINRLTFNIKFDFSSALLFFIFSKKVRYESLLKIFFRKKKFAVENKINKEYLKKSFCE